MAPTRVNRRPSAFEQRFATKITQVKRDGSFSAATERARQGSTEEQFYYSKKPRRVNYKPYSISDYAQMKERDETLGSVKGLGPDLDNERVRAAQKHRNKMMDYSKNVVQAHKEEGLPMAPRKDHKKIYTVVDGHGRWANEDDATISRDKALKYATTHIPKPTVTRRSMSKPAFAFGSTQRPKLSPYSRESVLDAIEPNSLSPGMKHVGGYGISASLGDLERRHEVEQAAVDDIMAEFS
ncbi:Protein of unknown function DUF4591 [Carpediemonas membranifera]|uniref:Uncharacterized protein n=1 Tax=Carpediemonas membranifera TaxID=201153 RepID=A0A8J6DYW6_9EUKA|nr:Protein of unknown function DUF4591 [Carpediemonas membranifera]|eukprot:KAG9389903.1 Protein of unknown function DUF4591 [Carpediemonas membranifera]